MYNARNSNERKASGRRTVRLSKSRLEALVEEATIDAYNEAEQAAGFFTMLLDALLVSIEQLGPSLSDRSSPRNQPLTRPATAGEGAVAVHAL